MGKLGTKNVGGDLSSKILEPGNHKCKIVGVKLEDAKYKPGALNLIFTLVGPEKDDYEGFLIDKDKPELGHYKGQVGYVKATDWAFADGTTKSGIEVVMVDEILKFIKRLCEVTGCMEWYDAQDNLHDSIEDFVAAMEKEKPFADIIIDCCIAGREYMSRRGYLNCDLYFPRFSRTGVPVEKAGTKPSKLIKYDAEAHLKKAEPKEVEEFDNSTEEMSETDGIPEGNTDFEV
jgi:hypothetical protein